ncbi:unnamed protein product, partial [marine sediment metagenome]
TLTSRCPNAQHDTKYCANGNTYTNQKYMMQKLLHEALFTPRKFLYYGQILKPSGNKEGQENDKSSP